VTEATLQAVQALQDLLTELELTHATFPVFNSTEKASLVELLDARDDLLSALHLSVPARLFSKLKPGTRAPQTAANAIQSVQTALTKVSAHIHQADLATTALGATGVFWSMCSNDKTRRMSLEVGANFWRTTEESMDFAAGKSIRLTTLMPAISWRVFSDPRFDVLDAGIGGGAYWFTSEGFEGFSGIVLQPGRLDFHAPTRWNTFDLKTGPPFVRTLRVLARLSALVNYRYAVTSFPAGFEANAFAGSLEHRKPIPAELIRTRSIFLNLKPLIQRTRSTG
jgi:hypothetical protein